METTVNQRIEELKKIYARGNNSEFERLVGMKTNSLRSIIGPQQSKPGFETLEAILKAFPNVNPDWLIIGVGERDRESVVEELKKVSYLEKLVKQLQEQIERMTKHQDILMAQLAKAKGAEFGQVVVREIVMDISYPQAA